MFEIIGHRCSRAILCTWLAAKGRVQFSIGRRRGDLTSARLTYERMIDIHWSSFTGHFQLGLIALHDDEPNLALEEFALANRINTKRFRRCGLPGELVERIVWREKIQNDLGLDWKPLEDVQPNWENVGVSGQGFRAAPRVREVEILSPSADAAANALENSDFTSFAEFRRFAELPPIAADDVANCDFDSLAERFAEEAS